MNPTIGFVIVAMLLGLAEMDVIFAGNNVGATLISLIPLALAGLLMLAIREAMRSKRS